MPLLDMQLFADLLAVGTAGLVFGVFLPWVFRLVGYVIDMVRIIVG